MKVVNHHHASLGLPLGGPVLPSGVETEVKRWNIIKGHSVVKAWLQAGVIEEAGESDNSSVFQMAPMTPETAGVFAKHSEEIGLDVARSGTAITVTDLVTGDAVTASIEDEITVLRAEYQKKIGKRAYHAWGAETLRAKIAEVE